MAEQKESKSNLNRTYHKTYKNVPVGVPFPMYEEILKLADERGELVSECCRRWVRNGLKRDREETKAKEKETKGGTPWPQ